MSERPAARPRSAYSTWREIPTRWADNDVYGHVNNVTFYSWFDTAVNAELVAQGLLDIEKGPVIGLVVETFCRYFAPLAFPQTIEAGLHVARIGVSSVRYELGIFAKGAQDPAGEGHFVHVYVDREARRPVALSDKWRRVLRTLG